MAVHHHSALTNAPRRGLRTAWGHGVFFFLLEATSLFPLCWPEAKHSLVDFGRVAPNGATIGPSSFKGLSESFLCLDHNGTTAQTPSVRMALSLVICHRV